MKSKKTVYLFALLCVTAFFTISCGKTHRGNGVLTSREINIDDFDEVRISGSTIFNYQQVDADASPYLQFTIDENLMEYVDIYVKRRTLHISLNDNLNLSYSPTKFVVDANSFNLKNIHSSGSAKINLLSDITTDRLEFEFSGSGSVTGNKPIIVNTLSIKSSGSSKASFHGEAQNCTLNISGSGNIIAPNFSTHHLKCSISGSGNVEMHVTESINCTISGSGTLTYSGNPTITQKISGSGRIVRKN